MEKNCKTCGHLKPLEEFYSDIRRPDGRMGICKECQKLVVKKAQQQRPEYYRLKQKERAARPEFRPHSTALSARRQKEVPGYKRAHAMVSNAIRAGRLTKLPCQMCGQKEHIHAHHDDYSMELDVMWLCPVHHKARHAFLEWLSNPA